MDNVLENSRIELQKFREKMKMAQVNAEILLIPDKCWRDAYWQNLPEVAEDKKEWDFPFRLYFDWLCGDTQSWETKWFVEEENKEKEEKKE